MYGTIQNFVYFVLAPGQISLTVLTSFLSVTHLFWAYDNPRAYCKPNYCLYWIFRLPSFL